MVYFSHDYLKDDGARELVNKNHFHTILVKAEFYSSRISFWHIFLRLKTENEHVLKFVTIATSKQ